MLFIEPGRTPYDLNFRLGDVDVRVHPMFWIVPILMLGGQGDIAPAYALIVVAASFVSILIHELGHVFAYRYYGTNADVVLYGMGGLAIARRSRWHGTWPQVFISFAGPLAGFCLAAFIFAALYAARVPMAFDWGWPYVLDYAIGRLPSPYLRALTHEILFICIYWGLVNLLPIYPLDGGQISRALFEKYDLRDGLRKSLILSIIAASAMTLYGLRSGSWFLTIMFGLLAYQSYASLQSTRGNFTRYPW